MFSFKTGFLVSSDLPMALGWPLARRFMCPVNEAIVNMLMLFMKTLGFKHYCQLCRRLFLGPLLHGQEFFLLRKTIYGSPTLSPRV